MPDRRGCPRLAYRNVIRAAPLAWLREIRYQSRHGHDSGERPGYHSRPACASKVQPETQTCRPRSGRRGRPPEGISTNGVATRRTSRPAIVRTTANGDGAGTEEPIGPLSADVELASPTQHPPSVHDEGQDDGGDRDDSCGRQVCIVRMGLRRHNEPDVAWAASVRGSRLPFVLVTRSRSS
jgi:hypothetical protein